jgi:hypothetical protein
MIKLVDESLIGLRYLSSPKSFLHMIHIYDKLKTVYFQWRNAEQKRKKAEKPQGNLKVR